MTERIAVGDLVQIIRPRVCCGESLHQLGRIFRVAEIQHLEGRCVYCGHEYQDGVASRLIGDTGYRLCRLKRIPPLSELESTKTNEPIKEPA